MVAAAAVVGKYHEIYDWRERGERGGVACGGEGGGGGGGGGRVRGWL